MKKLLKATFLVVFLYGSSLAWGQKVEPTYKIGFDSTEARVGDTIEVYIQITPPLGWHVYSNRTEGCEFEPFMAELNLQKNESFQVIGGLQSIGAKVKFDSMFECKIWTFDGIAIFKQKIVVLSKDLKLEGYFQGQMCNDEACIMLSPDDFEFTGMSIVD